MKTESITILQPLPKPDAKGSSLQRHGSTAGTMRIEIDLKEEPSEYGGAPHLRIMRAIEAAFPDAKNRSASRITWQSRRTIKLMDTAQQTLELQPGRDSRVPCSAWLGRVLVACEYSGIVRDAFAALGWDAWSCDLLPSEKPGNHHQGDVREILDQGWDIMVAHPPCTHLAVSGARWFPAKRASGEQQAALDFVRLLLDAPIQHIALENPVSIISSKIRKPDQVIQPWMFGHGETKATCLWLKNLPKITPTDVVAPEWAVSPDGTVNLSAKGKRDNPTHFLTGRIRVLKGAQREQWERIHRCPPGPDRWKIRSRTYLGIAEAFANQWTLATRPNAERSNPAPTI